MDSRENYRLHVYRRTGITVQDDDTLIAFHAMMEKFEEELLADVKSLYDDLKSNIGTLKLDADRLDADRRKKWLEDAERVQVEFTASLRRQANDILHEQHTSLSNAGGSFTKGIRAIMQEAENLYLQYFRYVFWYMPLGFAVLMTFAYFAIIRH